MSDVQSTSYMGPVSDSESASLSSKGIGNAGSPTAKSGYDPFSALFSQLYGSSGSSPNVASQNPTQDAQYNAWYRGMGMQNDLINANVNRDTANLQSQLEAQRPVWADTLANGLKQIGNTNEENGVYNSGQRLNQQDQFQVGQTRAQANYENGIRNQEGDLVANAQQQLLSNAQQNAEQQLAAQQRVAQDQMTSNPMYGQLMNQLLGSMIGGQ